MNIHFDWLAPIYDRAIGLPDPTQLQNALNLPTEGVLLDAGGGTGRVSSLLRPLTGGVIINDWSKPMLLQAREKGGLMLVNGRVETLPYPDARLERLLVVDALHHFPNQHGAIKEFARVLKPGGRVVIEEPDIKKFAVKLIAWGEKLALMGSHFHAPAEIATMLSAVGLSVQIDHDYKGAALIIADRQ